MDYAQIVIGADGAFSQGTRESATCERGPRNGANAKVLGMRKWGKRVRNECGSGRQRQHGSEGSYLPHLERGHHLALFFTVYEVIVVLHRNEGREAIIDRVICSEVNEWANQLLAISSLEGGR